MDETQIRAILALLLEKLQSEVFDWRLEGSANLKIQGLPVSVRDLDIATGDAGIAIFRNALKEFLVRDFLSPAINGHTLLCTIYGFEVEINAYRNEALMMFDKVQTIRWRGLQIPVLPLSCARKFYELTDRPEKAAFIAGYLEE